VAGTPAGEVPAGEVPAGEMPAGGVPARVLHEDGNPAHRVRVEHNRDTILVHLSGEDGPGWTVLAVDRATRQWAVGQGRRQLDAARSAFHALYDGP
jgi:hypothetical protein